MTTFAPHAQAPPRPRRPCAVAALALAGAAGDRLLAAAARLPPAPRRAPAAAAEPSEAGVSRNSSPTLWPLAEARGVSRATFERRLRRRDFRPDDRRHTRRTRPNSSSRSGVYLASAVSAARIERGRAKAEERARLARQSRGGLWRRPGRRHGRLGHGDRIRRLRGLGQRRSARSRVSPSCATAATIFATS